MCEIILDNDTTVLNERAGDRIIEIGCAELMNRVLAGTPALLQQRHARQRSGSAAGSGLINEFLSDKPKFSEIVGQLRNFLIDAELITHNAPFDIAFLDAELLAEVHLAKTRGRESIVIDMSGDSMSNDTHAPLLTLDHLEFLRAHREHGGTRGTSGCSRRS